MTVQCDKRPLYAGSTLNHVRIYYGSFDASTYSPELPKLTTSFANRSVRSLLYVVVFGWMA